MADDNHLRWPYGFRFEWKVKRVYRQSSGPNDDSNEPSIRIRPPQPPLPEILRNLPDQVGARLQSTIVSLSQFQHSLTPLHISSDTKRIVLQRVLGDMAGNERDSLLKASSWWRQNALEHGPGYVDALISHYLYLSMTTDLSTEWELSRKETTLRWENEKRGERRIALLPGAADHIAEINAASGTPIAIEAYLARAEAIRELIIYANKKICETISAKDNGEDLSVDCLIGTLLSSFNDNDTWKSAQLEKCKRVASIVQLNDLCERNNWSLVACHVETDDLSGRPKLFRRLLSVVSTLEDDPIRAKAQVRPAVQPFPMFILSEYKSSELGRTDLNWERCLPENHIPAKHFYPHNSEFKDLQNMFGRHDKDQIRRPEYMVKSMERKVALFDFFDEQSDRVSNPFAHFRHVVDDIVQLLITNTQPLTPEEHQAPENSPINNRINNSASWRSSQTQGASPETPRKLIIHPYQGTPTHTPLTNRKSSQYDLEADTPTRAEFMVDSEVEAKVELLRSDLAILFRALLTARDIDTTETREAISARLKLSNSLKNVVIDRLLENPTFQERYGFHGDLIDEILPSSQAEVKALVDNLVDDTAVVLQALLTSRGVDLAGTTSVVVNQLTSKLIPEDVAERALANPRVKARRRRKRKADEATALEIKNEPELERQQRARDEERRLSAGCLV